MLNIYLDGKDAKITAKNWSRFSGASLDTAIRDILILNEEKLVDISSSQVAQCIIIVASPALSGTRRLATCENVLKSTFKIPAIPRIPIFPDMRIYSIFGG